MRKESRRPARLPLPRLRGGGPSPTEKLTLGPASAAAAGLAGHGRAGEACRGGAATPSAGSAQAFGGEFIAGSAQATFGGGAGDAGGTIGGAKAAAGAAGAPAPPPLLAWGERFVRETLAARELLPPPPRSLLPRCGELAPSSNLTSLASGKGPRGATAGGELGLH